MRYDHPRELTSAQQYVRLRANLNCPGSGTLKPHRLSWAFVVRPTPLSRDYSLRIDYELGRRPEIFVDAPNLIELADGRRIPHLYVRTHPVSLCLYMRQKGDWDPSKPIDTHVVPWAVLWLFYFEHWLATDAWEGGGEHPPPSEEAPTKKKHNTRKVCH